MRRGPLIAGLVVLQLLLVGVGVWPQLSARLAGDSYRLRVEPVDPLDPLRGAYVELSYPDLRREHESGASESGTLYVSLARRGEVWVAAGRATERPSDGRPYLTCRQRWPEPDCGIGSFFLPQDKATRLERELARGAYAEVKVDGRGNAALVDVRLSP